MGKKWKCLNFKEKLAVIKMICEEKRNIRDVIEHFKCGKTQIYRILRQKDIILEKYHSNTNINLYRVRERSSRHTELDKIVLDWYVESKAKDVNVAVTGPMLQQKAKEVSETLRINGFSASNGWLQSFKSRHGIIMGRHGNTPKLSTDQTQEVGSDTSHIAENNENSVPLDKNSSSEAIEIYLESVGGAINDNVENSNDRLVDKIGDGDIPSGIQVSTDFNFMRSNDKIMELDSQNAKYFHRGGALDPTIEELKDKWRYTEKENKDRLNNLNFLDQSLEQGNTQENTFYGDKIHITPTSVESSVPDYSQNNIARSTQNAESTTSAEKSYNVRLKEEPFDEVESNEELNRSLERFVSDDNVRSDESHPIQIFFKSMAATVMTFPPELIAETRLKVCQLVTEMELRALRDENVKKYV